MAETKKTEAVVKPTATIKTPVTEKAETKVEAPKAEAKKPVAKKATTTKKTATKKAAPAKKTAEKATAAKKPAAKKATAAKKPAAKKAAAPKASEVKANIVLQYGDLNVTYDTIVQNSKNNYRDEKGGNIDEIKKLSVYVKPEEYAAYYVVNDKVQGRVGLYFSVLIIV